MFGIFSVMTRSITAQLRAAASMSSQRTREAIAASISRQRSRESSSEDDESSTSGSESDSNPHSSTPPSLRMPLGSCNGVGSLHHQVTVHVIIECPRKAFEKKLLRCTQTRLFKLEKF